MALQASYFKKTFQFSFPATTSRGTMVEKDSWFLKVWEQQKPEIFGIGEAGILVGLSLETDVIVDKELSIIANEILPKLSLSEINSIADIHKKIELSGFSSSVIFALENSLLDLINGGKRLIFNNTFFEGKPLPINGLVWMGDFDYLFQQVNKKVREGYRCIKIKVGALPIEEELAILRTIRTEYVKNNITLRLDANGAFNEKNVMDKLKEYSAYQIHSIEQPLKKKSGFLIELKKLSPIPLALDEELIGVYSRTEKETLLSSLEPAFIVLKPSLHGGMYGCMEWIELAKKFNVGWWVTSALESNIGLNAISQFTANFPIKIPQGLGTGSIYRNNCISPLEANGGWIRYDDSKKWVLSELC